MNNQEKPNIQVVCEPRNWGSLSTLYRVNNEKSIPYYHTAVEYKAHIPRWWSYVQTWWPTVGDLGYNSNSILERLTHRMLVGDQTSICLSNLDKQIMPPRDDYRWLPGTYQYGHQRVFRDGDVHADAEGVIGDALKAYVKALKSAGSESKLFLTLYFNIPAPMAKRVLDHFELGDLNIVESCQIFSEEIKELAEKCKLSWPQRDLDSWQEMTCGNRWISEAVFPAASRFGWCLNRATTLAFESPNGPLDKSLLHEVWVDMRNRPHLREFYHKLKLSNEPVAIHPESIGDEDWQGLSFLWGNHLIQHVGNNEFINPCPLMKRWINPKGT
jgi:hypothetical protein